MKNRVSILSAIFTLCIILGSPPLHAAEQVYFYYTDPAGTPLAMSDTSGTVVWRADYLPFGEEMIGTSTVQNNKMFVGKEKDNETGLHYFGARYMDSTAGRFVSPDPIGPLEASSGKINQSILLNPQRLNRYSYSLNSPYKYIDTDGKWSETVHNLMIDMAFSTGPYKLTSEKREILKMASKYADSMEFQDAKHGYMHGMSSDMYSSQLAEKFMNHYVAGSIDEYKRIMSEGADENYALFVLGMAMHAIMDSTSPLHENFQKFSTSDLKGLYEGSRHLYKEDVGTFKSDLKYMNSVFLIRRLFDEAIK